MSSHDAHAHMTKEMRPHCSGTISIILCYLQLLRCVISGVMTAIPKRIALRYPGDFDVIADKTRVTMVTGVGATTIARITRVQ